jgi:tetratricopeptide (TPR) repeat protein
MSAAVCGNWVSAAPSAAGEAAKVANERFWSALHGADYGAYPQALTAGEAALAQAPDDAKLNAHLGWLHIWHLSEAGNFQATPQDRRADLTSAGHYFKRAVELDRHEARYLGFYATTLIVESALTSDAAESGHAEATMERAVRLWPEFNLFTAGYIHSSDPYDSREYATALTRMWQNVDVCIARRISRLNPDLSQYPLVVTNVGPKRACWNSAIAPHNFEGFFLNFGDMLVKNGDVTLARTMYANARLSPGYREWKYRDVLERRITDADTNVGIFRGVEQSQDPDSQLMLESNFSCMACHRR